MYRDQLMVVLDRKYPGFGFATHAGYPTAAHRQAIAEIGPCRVHRVTFRGVKEYVQVLRSHGAEEAETASAA